VTDEHAELKRQLYEAILRHLTRHPRAADTSEGILKSWLPLGGVRGAEQHIDAVLSELVHRHRLVAHTLPDGTVLFVASGSGTYRPGSADPSQE
jgi:hypothetical protein